MSLPWKKRNKTHTLLLFLCFGILFLSLLFFSKENLSISAEIYLNPLGKTPLTAALDITGTQTGELSITVAGKGDTGVPIQNTYSYNGNPTRFPIVGLYSDYNNSVLIELTDSSGKILYKKEAPIQTPDISGLAKVQIDVKKNEIVNYEGLYTFVGSHTAFDTQGELRYFLDDPTLGNILTYLKNGNYLYEGNEEKILYQAKYFYEVDIFGNRIQKYTIPKRYHHDVIEMQNGNLLVLGNSQDFLTLIDPRYREDTILVIDRKTGEEIQNIDFYDLMSDVRPTNPEIFLGWSSTGDWLHMNSASLVNDSTVIISMKAINAVAQINLEQEAIEWILYEDGKSSPSLQSISLTPLNAPAGERFFPAGQHSASLNEKGNLVLFDNGQKNPNTYADVSFYGKTRILEYQINSSNKTAEIVWNYIPNPSIYVEKQGSVNYTDEGNMLIGFTDTAGNIPKLQEFSPEGELIFEADEASGLKGNFYYRVYKHKYR